jgi:hypothetical protein
MLRDYLAHCQRIMDLVYLYVQDYPLSFISHFPDVLDHMAGVVQPPVVAALWLALAEGSPPPPGVH